MDRNTLTGFILIALIFVGFYFWNTPSQEQIEAQRQRQIEAELQAIEKQQQALLDQNILTEAAGILDSAQIIADRENRFGVFASTSVGEETTMQIESDLLRLTFSTKGGRISSAELKNFRTHDSLPLYLFDGAKEADYGFSLITANNRILNTSDLYFQALPVQKTDSVQIVTMRLIADSASYMDFVYTIPNNDYMTRFEVITVGMSNVLSPVYRELEMQWRSKARQQEQGRDFENRYTQLYFKNYRDNVESLSETKSEKKQIPTKVKWIAFKNQFFSSILIADNHLASPELESVLMEPSSPFLKEYFARVNVPFNTQTDDKIGFSLYLGPNQFKILNGYNEGLSGDDRLNLEQIINLGWALFRWINRWLIIPMFNFFGSFIGSMGLIIFLMTLVIKFVLFPLTYKSYISSAKMRVLKPEIEKINEKIPASKPQDRQRATMDLYSKVGVNPMGGCLPMLLQMPFLISLFYFFPAAIELRQQSFLWAADLSTYDAVFYLPFEIPFYGAHVSLFCLLMSIVNVAYTKINMATQDMGGQQMPGMKYMMYLMPVMFLFFFNSYPSGLSYYYLVSTLITVLQTYAIRATVDEQKLLAELNENRKKPKKKSGFMARLEEAQKKQLEAQRKQAKKK